MALNPNISLAVKGLEVQDPLAQYGKVMAIQGAQQQNQLMRMQMEQAQREQESSNALNRAYAEAYNPQTGEVDVNRLRQSLATGGLGSKLPAIEKNLLEMSKAKTEQQKAQTELLDAKLKQSRGFLDTIDPNAPGAADAYIAWHEANHKDPIIGPALAARGVTADQSRGRIMQMIQTPGGLARLINESKLGTEKFMEFNKPVLSTKDVGGEVVDRTFEPITGKVTEIARTSKTMAPGEAQRLALEQQRVGLEGQRVGLEGRRVAVAEEESKRKAAGLEGIAPKDLQKREAAYPQATASIKGFESKSDGFIKDLEALRDDPGLNSITGAVYGRTPSVTGAGRRAQALYDKIVAKGGFQMLQDIKAASATGGALGSVSNQEGRQLQAAFAAIDQKQDAADVRNAINRAIEDIKGSKARMREAYDMTYDYRSNRPSAQPAQPAQPAAGGIKFLGFE